MTGLLQDFRYSARKLVRSPGFTVVAVTSLALGIGANTAIFTLIDATVLRPLHGIRAPQQLFAVYTVRDGDPHGHATYADYVDYRDGNQVFSGLAAHSAVELSLSTNGTARRVQGAIVSANYFTVLGVAPRLGRGFLPEEADPLGRPAVAVISDGLWRRLYGSDPGVVGRTLELNGQEFSIVGVAPPGFSGTRLTSTPEVWIPLLMAQAVATGFSAQFELVSYTAQRHTRFRLAWLDLIGRLRPAVDPTTARTAMDALAGRLSEEYGEGYGGEGVTLVPASTDATPLNDRADLVRFMGLLVGVVGLALLIACANLANLFLARATTRDREIGVRLALGAGRGRLVRQSLTESLLLSGLGAVAGVLLAEWGLELLSAFRLPGDITIGGLALESDAWVLASTLGLALLTGLAIGVAPAYRAGRPGAVRALRDRIVTQGRRGSRLRDALVIGQVALCLILLIGAGLFVRSLRHGLRTDLGFATEDVLFLSFELGAQGYDEPRAEAFYRQLLERTEALLTVRSASLTSAPFGHRAMGVTSIFIDGVDLPPDENDVRKHLNFVGPSYVAAMGMRLLRGRDLTLADAAAGTARIAAVISRVMARRYWPDQNPIGQRFRFAPEGRFFEVVGVVDDPRHESLRETESSLVYVYLPTAFRELDEMTLVVRAEADPRSLAGPVREVVRALDPKLPVYGVGTTADRVARLLMPQRLGSILLSALAGLALLLASLGIYGTIAFSVGQRTREIGIRMALGARSRAVLGMIVRQGTLPVVLGIVLGLTGAMSLARFVESFLYGVGTTDGATLLATSLILFVVGLVAAYIPARRAAAIDPMNALRHE